MRLGICLTMCVLLGVLSGLLGEGGNAYLAAGLVIIATWERAK